MHRICLYVALAVKHVSTNADVVKCACRQVSPTRPSDLSLTSELDEEELQVVPRRALSFRRGTTGVSTT